MHHSVNVTQHPADTLHQHVVSGLELAPSTCLRTQPGHTDPVSCHCPLETPREVEKNPLSLWRFYKQPLLFFLAVCQLWKQGPGRSLQLVCDLRASVRP